MYVAVVFSRIQNNTWLPTLITVSSWTVQDKEKKSSIQLNNKGLIAEL